MTYHTRLSPRGIKYKYHHACSPTVISSVCRLLHVFSELLLLLEDILDLIWKCVNLKEVEVFYNQIVGLIRLGVLDSVTSPRTYQQVLRPLLTIVYAVGLLYNVPSRWLGTKRTSGIEVHSHSSFSYLDLSVNSLNSVKIKIINNIYSFTKELNILLSEQRVLCDSPMEKLSLS